jgi:hypothetical protein
VLELRPNCEHCGNDLPPDSTEAMICSFECTFCRNCVDTVLENVCPTCGGGFCMRPIRPATIWNNGLSLAKYPASTKVVCKPVNIGTQRAFNQTLKDVAPERR